MRSENKISLAFQPQMNHLITQKYGVSYLAEQLKLIQVLFVLCLSYCNTCQGWIEALLRCLPALNSYNSLAMFISIQNAATNIIFLALCFDHVTFSLHHSFSFFHCIKLKILVFTFKTLHGIPPCYLLSLIHCQKVNSHLQPASVFNHVLPIC